MRMSVFTSRFDNAVAEKNNLSAFYAMRIFFRKILIANLGLGALLVYWLDKSVDDMSKVHYINRIISDRILISRTT